MALAGLKGAMEKKAKGGGFKVPQPPAKLKARAGGKASAQASFVMFIGDEGAILVATKGKKVTRRLFAPSPHPDHMKSMVEFMQGQPNVPLYLLLDVIDQQYVKQTFPPVSSLSVSKLVNRRLRRDFPPEDIKGAISLGREAAGRKEWSYLLVALSKTPQLQAWLEVLLELPNECKGMYLTPVEAQHYLPLLLDTFAPEAKTPWKLLVSHNKVGGIRQVVLRDNRLAFTRITQSADDTNHALTAGNIEQEIQNTIDYLRRLGFADNRDMSAIVITSQEVKDLLDLPKLGMGYARAVMPFDVAEALSLEQAALSGDRYGDVVMAAAFAIAGKKGCVFMSPYATQLSQLYMARRGMKWGAVGIAALCLLSMFSDGMDILSNSEAESRARAEAKSVTSQVNEAQSAIASLDHNTALWTSVVAVYDVYFPNRYAPAQFVQALAPLLNGDAHVVHMEWSYALPPAGPTPAPVPAKPGDIDGPTQIAVDVEFNGTFQDQDQYSKAVQGFYNRLQEGLPDYKVVADNLPGTSQSGQKVEISFDAAKQTSPAALNQKVTFKFYGPKPAAPDAKGATP